MKERATIRVIGIGNRWRGDDAVGLSAVERLRGRLGPAIDITEAEGDGLAILELLEGADHVVLIDAVNGGGQPGEVVRLDLSTASRWGTMMPRSTHAWGLAAAIDLARTLERLPKYTVFYGIVVESLESGAALSENVRAGMEKVVEKVCLELQEVECTKYM
ncbi:hydrogenase maturation protease [Petrachloros mirabilis]